MATITGTPTFPQVEGILRRDFFRAFLQETGLGATGQATGGTQTTIVDTTRLQSSQYDSKDHVGGWARISYDAGGLGAAPQGEQGAVTAYAPSTGTITIDPAISVAPATGDWYELWHSINPADAKDMLDSCLVNDIFMPCWTILTEVPDGDMEQNNTTDWTGVNATITKEIAEPTMYGKRKLQVVATAGNGYAKNASDLLIEPNSIYHLSALARATASGTTAKLQAWDATNNVEISSQTSTYQFSTRIHFEFTTPATCNRLQIRLITVENGMTTEWDEVCSYPVSSQDIKAPWWVKSRQQILGILRMAPTELATNVWDGGLAGEPDKKYFPQDLYQGKIRIQSRLGQIGGRPLFILGLRNETAYSSDTEKKYVDLNLLFSCFGFKLYGLLYQRSLNNNVQSTKLKEMRDTFYWNWKQAESAQLDDLNRIFANTTSPEVWVGDELSRYRYGRQ